jgi:pimeloyl-ACP methyl ester carboxylesterase
MKTKICIFAIALLTTLLNLNAQSNNYVWIHGLGGSADSWNVYQNAFTPSNGTRPDYKSDKSITNIAQGYWSENYDRFGKNTILVGHSMGGLVARELERNHSSSIKGIITIGTGHQGANFSKELKFGGELNQLVNGIVSRVGSCATSTSVALGFTFPGASGFFFPIARATDGIANTLVSPLANLALNGVAALVYSPECTKDLQPNSEFIKTLETRKVNVPILTFASEEERWQLARFVRCQANYKELATNANINSDGNYDMAGYNALNTTNNVIKTGGQLHTGAAVVCGVAGFWLPYLWAAAAAHTAAAVTWYSTSNYIDNGLDYDHAELVGATRTDYITLNYTFLWKKWQTKIPIKVAEPHDGIVPVKSQQLDKSKGNNVIWANTTIKGVNHAEQRNHPNTKREFDAVLNGRSYRPDVFDKNR